MYDYVKEGGFSYAETSVVQHYILGTNKIHNYYVFVVVLTW